MKNREIANRIAELHYPNEPNVIHDQKYRLVRMKILADQVESELNLLTIPVVIVSDFCECDGVQDLHAMTGECRKCGKECTYQQKH